MIGYLVWKAKGWRIRYYEEEINGMHFLRAEVPGIPGTARGVRLRRKAVEVLRRNGVSRFLNPELEGGQAVATGPLWRALAAPLALTGLTVQGIPHDQALVALHAGKVDRSIITCCTALASEVRALSLDMPDREGLAWALQRRFGIPVLEQGGDVALCFSGRKQGIDLRGDTPQPGGIFVGLFRSDASGRTVRPSPYWPILWSRESSICRTFRWLPHAASRQAGRRNRRSDSAFFLF